MHRAQALCGHSVGIDFAFGQCRQLDVGEFLFFEAFEQNVLIVAKLELARKRRRGSIGGNFVMFEPLY